MNSIGSALRFARESPQARLLVLLVIVLLAVIAFQWWASRPRSQGEPGPITHVMRSHPDGARLSVEEGISECMKRRRIEPVWAAYDLYAKGNEVAVSFIFKDQGQTQEALWTLHKDTKQVTIGNEAARMLGRGCQ